MSDDVLRLPAGDPSGSETFGRYRYQAKLTLIYWLGTLSNRTDLKAVYAEHVEDILLEYPVSLVFIQVKTRAANAGVWTAEKMCSEGGGVDSLCRAYVVARDRNCTFELHLEGSVSSSRATQDFVAGCSNAAATVRSKITGHLEKAAGSAVDTTEVEDFLSRLRIVPNRPSQHDIDAKCVRMLARLAPNLLAGTLDDLYRRLLAIVETAQEARPAGLAPDADAIAFLEAELADLSPESSAQDNPRRLTRDRLQALIGGSAPGGALLLVHRMVKGLRPVTALEENRPVTRTQSCASGYENYESKYAKYVPTMGGTVFNLTEGRGGLLIHAPESWRGDNVRLFRRDEEEDYYVASAYVVARLIDGIDQYAAVFAGVPYGEYEVHPAASSARRITVFSGQIAEMDFR